MRMRNLLLAVAVLGLPLSTDAQWVKHPTPGLPRTADGRPDLKAPAPRSAPGQPDLSGVWQAQGGPIPDLIRIAGGGENGLGEDLPSKYFINLLGDFAPGQAPLRPKAAAHDAGLSIHAANHDDVDINCLPSGMPMFVTTPAPFKIVQTPGLILMLSESDTSFRQIFMDGRRLPDDPQPSWIGSSIGHWDGDTLVVESNGFNDRGQLDAIGHRHSAALRLTERYRRLDTGRMDVQFTFDDPETFTQPLVVTVPMVLRADTDLIEYICAENEKDRHRVTLRP